MTGAVCIPSWVLWYLGGSVGLTVVCVVMFARGIRRGDGRNLNS